MILLHHPDVELSRVLLASVPVGVEVVEGPGGYAVSAYPSVVVPVHAYTIRCSAFNESGEFIGIEVVTVPEHEEIIRLPVSWAAVQEYVDAINSRASDTEPDMLYQLK